MHILFAVEGVFQKDLKPMLVSRCEKNSLRQQAFTEFVSVFEVGVDHRRTKQNYNYWPLLTCN